MNLCYAALGILGFIALKGETKPSKERPALRSVDKLLAEFDEVTQEMAKQDFLKDLVNRIDNGKVHTKNAFDTYTSATKRVLKCCELTTPLLDQLINSNDASKAQKSLLTTSLKDGLQKMEASQKEIHKSIPSFNSVSGDIAAVLSSIAADFYNKTVEFKNENRALYENLKNKVMDLQTHVGNLKSQLRFEIGIISDITLQAELTNDFSNFREIPNGNYDFHDEIHESAKGFITKCNRYLKRHE